MSTQLDKRRHKTQMSKVYKSLQKFTKFNVVYTVNLVYTFRSVIAVEPNCLNRGLPRIKQRARIEEHAHNCVGFVKLAPSLIRVDYCPQVWNLLIFQRSWISVDTKLRNPK